MPYCQDSAWTVLWPVFAVFKKTFSIEILSERVIRLLYTYTATSRYERSIRDKGGKTDMESNGDPWRNGQASEGLHYLKYMDFQ